MKPTCQLTGTDGNVFFIVAVVTSCLNVAGQEERANEFIAKAFACANYDEVLKLCFDYVEVV